MTISYLFHRRSNAPFVAVLALCALSSSVSLRADEAVTVTISGTVVDDRDQPVAGAAVLLSDGPMLSVRLEQLYRDVPVQPEIIARTATRADGGFSIDLTQEGCESYWARTWLVLWVHRPGSALTTYLVGRDWPVHAAPINVRLSEASPIPIKVIAPDGNSLPSARVSPEQIDGVRLPRELAPRLVSISDRSGRAVLSDVALGSLDLVRIETEAFGIQWAGLPAADVDGARKVTLLPVGTIHGRVTADDPRAIAAVPIRLATWLTAGDDAAGGGLAEAVSGADGRFEVPAMAAGALSVRAEARPELPFRGLPIVDRPLTEATATELTIKLERAVRIDGMIRDRDSGAPLAGAAVWLDYQSPRDLARSDEQGRYGSFLLPGETSPSPRRMPRGYYFPQYTLDTQPVPAEATQVELKPLLLARGATLHGRIVDAQGQPVAGAEIDARGDLASGGESGAHAWSDRDGAFSIFGIAPQVQVRLSAWSTHGATAKAFSVPPGRTEPVELAVSSANGPRLEGRVLNAQRAAISGATVRIRCQRLNAAGHPEEDKYFCFEGRRRLATDDEGRFRTPPRLAAGWRYRAEVTAPGMLPVMTAFTQKTADFGDIVLGDVPELRAIDGRVLNLHGKPVAGMRVFQTGDGPRCTEAATDDQGRFRLSGVYAGPVFLLVGGKGYPLQGFLFDGGGPAEFSIRHKNDPAARQLKTLAEPLSLSQRRETGLRLIGPMLPALEQGGLQAEKVWLLSTLATLDANRVAELADLPVFNQEGLSLGDEARYQAALVLVAEDEAEALAVGESIGAAHYRGRLYLAVCDHLPDDERGRKAELLATALLHARAETDVAQRVELMGRIAERWIDLGELERGTSLLREGQALAEGLPAPSEATERAHDLAAHLRAYFAGSLARIDGPAAIKLSAGFTEKFADRYRIVVARGLAAHDAEAAERLLGELDFSNTRYWQALDVLHRMASIDLERAARLALNCGSDNERGYALGIVAHGGRQRDPVRAAALVEEAFARLEQASADGVGVTDITEHPAVLAAALLPVAERIDPASLEGYFWRAMALRSPRPQRPPEQHGGAVIPGVMAMFVSRYDREAARVLAQPIAAQIETLASDGDYWTSKLPWASLAVVDATWAAALVETLPEPPRLALRAPKNVARRSVADALAPSADGWWRKLYKQGPTLRDPDARDDER